MSLVVKGTLVISHAAALINVLPLGSLMCGYLWLWVLCWLSVGCDVVVFSVGQFYIVDLYERITSVNKSLDERPLVILNVLDYPLGVL